MTQPDLSSDPAFRLGVLFAASVLRRAINASTEDGGRALERIESNDCCREAVTAFAMGMHSGLVEQFGTD